MTSPSNKENQPPSINNPVPIDQSVQAQLDLLRADLNMLISTHIHDGLGATRIQLDDIMGLFETVSEIPTGVPKSVYDQVKLFVSGEIILLYFYDTVSQVWRAMGMTGAVIYSGRIGSTGTELSPTPDSWTVATPATGEYVITHNLGDTGYAVVVSTDDNDAVAYVDAKGSDDFTVKITTLGDVAVDNAFYFTLALYP